MSIFHTLASFAFRIADISVILHSGFKVGEPLNKSVVSVCLSACTRRNVMRFIVYAKPHDVTPVFRMWLLTMTLRAIADDGMFRF